MKTLYLDCSNGITEEMLVDLLEKMRESNEEVSVRLMLDDDAEEGLGHHLGDANHAHVYLHKHNMDDDNIRNHEDSHSHTHIEEHHMHDVYHTEDLKKTILNRISRAGGHLESVRRMVEDNRDASDVLIQLSAVESSLRSTSRVIIKEHFKYAIENSAKDDASEESLEKVYGLVDKFLK